MRVLNACWVVPLLVLGVMTAGSSCWLPPTTATSTTTRGSMEYDTKNASLGMHENACDAAPSLAVGERMEP